MRIFIHIGYYKTGSTALQHFMDINRDLLKAHGVCYPRAGRPANDLGPISSTLPQLSVLSLGLLEGLGAHVPDWYARGRAREPTLYDVREQWINVVAELRQSECPLGMISSEEFVRFGEEPAYRQLVEFVADSLREFEVTVLCYLRRPDLYLESWYNQLIKLGIRMPRLRANLKHFTKTIHVDFMKALRPWIDIFGPARMLLRNYEPIKSRRMGILSEIPALFGIPIDDEKFNFQVPDNPSIPNALLEIKRLSNHWNETPAELQRTNRVIQFLESNWELPSNSEIELLDVKNRFMLARSFRKCHAELSALKGSGTPFFPALEDLIFERTSKMTDMEAAVRYAGIFQFVLSHMP